MCDKCNNYSEDCAIRVTSANTANPPIYLQGVNNQGCLSYIPIGNVSGGVTTNSLSLTPTALSSVVDGVPSVVPLPSGTVVQVIGFDSIGNPIKGAYYTLATSSPAFNNVTSIPTEYYGASNRYLGQPSGWLDFNGKKVPYYS